ncbi:glycosyl hydrolase [Marinimicrobium locisalis]|uniref:glycosyl hydrolase n=1 Tax=Marinimicrobium locisalis TaxID=546022 RepID=UPI0032220494
MKPLFNRFAWRSAMAATLLLCGGAAHANTVSGAHNTSATLSIQSDWGSGYCASVTVSNNGSAAVSAWELTMDPKQSQISNLWNGNFNGETVTPMGYNREIRASGSVNFGFCANSTGSNYLAELIELTVEGGGGASSSASSLSSSISSSASSAVSSSVASSVASSEASSVASSMASSVASSVSSSLSSSVASSVASSASSSTSSSAGGDEIIPNATSNGWPYCRSADSDPDGDGWGWENSYSCIVYESAADPGAGDFPYCMIGEEEITLCNTDTGSWGSEGGAICLSQSMCPGMGSNTQGPMRDEPVNPHADETTESVYSYLQSVWGSKMLTGQMDQTWQDDIDQYQRVINDTGKAPAIMGYDFMNYGLYWDGISGLTQTEEAIEHWERGGLVTFNWHWRDPDAPEGEIGEFYTEDTDFTIPVVEGELDTTSTSFANIEADVDMIAAELQTLEDAGVTVLWRPLHEASGGWFWWGRNDRTDEVPSAYAQVLLWQYLYDRLTNYHGLNNLLWVWNGQSAAWYPGDNYVDIVGHDIYDGAQNYESQIGVYELAASEPHEQKMVALTENSNIPDPDLMAEDGAWWLYFMVWNDIDTAEGVTNESNFWTGEYFNTQAHKEHVYNHELVITLDELPTF